MSLNGWSRVPRGASSGDLGDASFQPMLSRTDGDHLDPYGRNIPYIHPSEAYATSSRATLDMRGEPSRARRTSEDWPPANMARDHYDMPAEDPYRRHDYERMDDRRHYVGFRSCNIQ